MALVNAVITTKAREVAPKMYGGIIPFSPVAYFRIGEGGWIDPGSGRTRRNPPDPALLDLDIIADAGRAGPDKRYNVGENAGYYQKTLTPADFVFEGPSTLRIRCFLDFGEYNVENAAGATLIYDVGGPYNPPEMWELGVYDAANNLIGYGTFPMQVKDGTKQIENIMRLVW